MATGLDRAAAPAPATALQMLQEVNGGFWCVYIGGPSSLGSGWTPALVQAYAAAGVQSFLPLYCGRQAGGPLTADQGFQDGRDAVNLLQRFNWGPGTPCALDIEQNTSTSDLEGAVAYADGYSVALRRAGYSPGVYAVPSFLTRLSTETNKPDFVFAASWVRTVLDPSRDPAHIMGLNDSLWPGARVWQYAGGADVLVGGLNVDIDVANVPLAAPPVANAPAAAVGGGASTSYVVHAGDTLTAIAAAFALTLEALLAANPQVANPNLIWPGEILQIPDAAGGNAVRVGAQRPRLLDWARAQIGKPYTGPVVGMPDDTRFGSPGFDCSSFVEMAYAEINLALTPFTDSIAAQTTQIDPGDALPGDIVLFRYDDPDQPEVTYPHVALFLSAEGDGQMLDCEPFPGTPEDGVQERSFLARPFEIHRHPGIV